MIPSSIVIDGERIGNKHMIYINTQRILISRIPLRFLSILAVNRLLGKNDGWVDRQVLYFQAAEVKTYIYWTKREIVQAAPTFSDWHVFENNTKGYYRLNADPSIIKINIENIEKLGFFDIQRPLQKLRTKQKGVLKG